ncbi:asparagine synthase-related protein [Micromonospora sp. WMMD1102]|uniref:asparagine synthetase B family protein n=1 Tax=Micromonospora sp. WMMD1102 TaxID=3016105 RepID=UPI0024158061|nr:asparagine synthase-related protein [Micromonospora sp. WMMD1102]MDG4787423.1 asparagine synthase-related protein [Micromonospora sp. WMMD1102]
MSGIVLTLGSGADRRTFHRMMAELTPRGDLAETRLGPELLAGVQRLRIVDRERAVQPWCSADGRWLLCYNGEVYNHRELAAELSRLGRPPRTDSDTEVVLEAFLAWGPEAVTRLRGEFALALADTATGRLYLARDPLGVRPLYWSRHLRRLHVASEVKALAPVGAPISELPPGQHGWADATGGPDLVPYLDLARLGTGQPPLRDVEEAAELLRTAVRDSVRARVDTDLTVGVLLSGGLASTIALLHVQQLHHDCVAFTVGAADSPDVRYARRLAAELGVHHEVIEVRPRDIQLDDVRAAIRISELTEYADLIDAVVSVPLFRRVRDLGVRVVLTGDGADHLFGGHPGSDPVGPEAAGQLFRHRIRNLCRTGLQRVDRTGFGHGVEARLPFLDLSLVELAMRLPAGVKLRDGRRSWILRHAFADLLPEYVRDRPAEQLAYATGLYEGVRPYRAIFARQYRAFGYELLEPVRRDFDTVLRRCGHDLDRAVATGTARPDVLDHARDLAGMARWKVGPAWRRLTGSGRHG